MFFLVGFLAVQMRLGEFQDLMKTQKNIWMLLGTAASLGAIFLKERLNYWQSLALGMLALGILNFLWDFDSLPWIVLSLAFTFPFYGLLRKMISVKSLVGLLIKTLLLAPFAAFIIVGWNVNGKWNISVDWIIVFF